MQPATPLVLCVLLSQVGKRGLLGAPRAPFLHYDCLARAGRGGFHRVGGLRVRRRRQLGGSKGRSFSAPEILGWGGGRWWWAGGLPLWLACVCVCVCVRSGEVERAPSPFFSQAGATFSPASSGVTLIRLLSRLMHWRDSVGGDSKSHGFPQPSADRGSAARVRTAGCRAGEADLVSPTSRAARVPSLRRAARRKPPRASRTPQPGCRCRSKAPAAPASGSIPFLTSGP